MLSRDQHKIHLTNILLDLYRDSYLAQELGFKGGTAAYFFYGLPRFSVDLDFDVIGPETNDVKLREHIEKRIGKGYIVKNRSHKQNTLFWLLSYGSGEANIKLEVSTRRLPGAYQDQVLYGVNIPVMTPGDMLAYKLAAISGRKLTANRDLFDAHFFLNSPAAEKLNGEIIESLTSQELPEFLDSLLVFLKKYHPQSILAGLGELLTPAQKDWVKRSLLTELIGLLERQIEINTD